MSFALSSATPEVRTVPTCSDLSENAHILLALLTRTRGQNKGWPRVKGDLTSWSATLDWPREKARLVLEDLQDPEQHEFVRRDPNRPNGLVLALLCECPAGKKTDPSIPPRSMETESTGTGALELAPRVSSPASCGRKSNPEKGCETPGQDPETFFQNGAADEPEAGPRPRRPGPDSAWGLAEYFADKVVLAAQRQGIRLLPGSVNRRMLARHTKTLLAEMSPDEVRSFIDHFAKGYRRYHKPGVDPGKVFLARRRGLYEEYRKAKTFSTERDINKIKASGRRYATPDDFRRKTS